MRFPMQWLLKPVKKHVLGTEARLFLLVLYRSHWGQRGVKLTDAVAAEVGVASSTKRVAVSQLERKGWIRVERHPGFEAPVVWPIVVAA